jgi:L-ribulose-5-phosphate 4-epimerase
MSYDDLRRIVYDLNMALAKSGLVVLTWGNASGVDRKGDNGRGVIAIKPSGVEYDKLKSEDIVIVSLTSGQVLDGTKRPSSDTGTHLELYRAFANVAGVVHTHSFHATAFAQAGCGIDCLGTTHADHFHGMVPVTRELTDDEINGDYELNTGKVIVERFRGANIDPDEMPAVLVARHAPFVWGSTPQKALENAMALEYIAGMQFKTFQLKANVQAVSPALLEKHFKRKHGAGAYYGQAGTK